MFFHLWSGFCQIFKNFLFKTCIVWLYALPLWVPASEEIEPFTTPYILPFTHIALTGEDIVSFRCLYFSSIFRERLYSCGSGFREILQYLQAIQQEHGKPI